ncbi:MAG: DUF6691 family protein [Kofleriaceae bacterium]
MKGIVSAIVAGALFAVGLAISGMTDPVKVTAFLDVTGAWDPSLAFVMAAAIAVHLPLVRLARQRRAPLFDTKFHWPTNHGIDARLILGSAIFGVGWGLSGYCPGPAVTSLVAGLPPLLAFVGAMLVGLLATRAIAKPS